MTLRVTHENENRLAATNLFSYQKIPDLNAKRTVMIRKVSQNQGIKDSTSFKDHSIILEETDEDIDI
jgi:hypothetical protein